MEEEKEADNRIIINKKRLTYVEDQIDFNKGKLKSLDDMEEGFSALSKNINRCVDLLSQSMKGNNIEHKLGSIGDNNKIYLSRAMGSIDDERKDAKKALEKLYDEKDKLEKEKKELLKELGEEEVIEDVDPVLKKEDEEKEQEEQEEQERLNTFRSPDIDNTDGILNEEITETLDF